jgi:hypothetical protein
MSGPMKQMTETTMPIAPQTSIEKLTVSTSQVDSALRFLHSEEASTEHIITAVNERALVRKIDWMIMPLMSAVYFLQYIDKTLSIYPSLLLYPTLFHVNTSKGSAANSFSCRIKSTLPM